MGAADLAMPAMDPDLQEGQRLSVDLGAGLCHQLHIEADDAHVLVYSAKRGARPGSAPPRYSRTR